MVRLLASVSPADVPSGSLTRRSNQVSLRVATRLAVVPCCGTRLTILGGGTAALTVTSVGGTTALTVAFIRVTASLAIACGSGQSAKRHELGRLIFWFCVRFSHGSTGFDGFSGRAPYFLLLRKTNSPPKRPEFDSSFEQHKRPGTAPSSNIWNTRRLTYSVNRYAAY